MACLLPVLVALICVSNAISEKLGPCKKGDDVCLTQSTNKVYHAISQGVPSLDIDPSDPLFQHEIQGDLSILKFKFTNSTVKGFKNCEVKNVQTDFNALTVSWMLDCPKLSMSGNYVINGRLIILPVEGDGTYSINSGRYVYSIDGELKIKPKSGKNYLSIANIKVKSEALEPSTFDFKNLFNGQKDLSDATHKFANENWKEVLEFVQDPVMTKLMKALVKNYNKFLKTQPMEEIFVE